jgi:hypothetical protein
MQALVAYTTSVVGAIDVPLFVALCIKSAEQVKALWLLVSKSVALCIKEALCLFVKKRQSRSRLCDSLNQRVWLFVSKRLCDSLNQRVWLFVSKRLCGSFNQSGRAGQGENYSQTTPKQWQKQRPKQQVSLVTLVATIASIILCLCGRVLFCLVDPQNIINDTGDISVVGN